MQVAYLLILVVFSTTLHALPSSRILSTMSIVRDDEDGESRRRVLVCGGVSGRATLRIHFCLQYFT